MNDRLHEMQRKNTHVTNYQINRNASLLECSVFENEIGIHTIEFHYGVPAQGNELFLIWNVLKSGERYPKRFSMACLIPGLFAEMLGHEYYPVLKMLVNPRVMANGRDGYLGITSYDADTLQQCRTIFDRFWQQKGIGIRMNTCTIARVDLCVNLELSEWFPIPQYLNLLKRSPRKKSFILQHYDDAVMDGHQFKIVNQNWGLSVYDKRFEQKQYPVNQGKEYPNIMRVELQLYHATIRKMEKDFPVANFEMLWELMVQSPALIGKKIREILGCEHYVSQEKIRACIEQSSYQTKTKNQLLKMQKFLYQADDFKQFADQLCGSGQKLIYYRLLKCYREMKISPVALPKRSGWLRLPSLYMLAGWAIYKATCEK